LEVAETVAVRELTRMATGKCWHRKRDLLTRKRDLLTRKGDLLHVNREMLASAGLDREVVIWDAATAQAIASMPSVLLMCC
jgi:hypothetical protein